ncbi:hypothetical protein M514_09030 [Trichuris suis]|uniref:Uncharacterized protein n=1 Tax=Trichuris suis TaxID=68888 RepID=A0A085MZA1_9BILA|nr:hypothetical protein M513_09030 [Trichuris suis]KFD62547.1 hypothetical protein M514_09030 [Trichuris suis]
MTHTGEVALFAALTTESFHVLDTGVVGALTTHRKNSINETLPCPHYQATSILKRDGMDKHKAQHSRNIGRHLRYHKIRKGGDFSRTPRQPIPEPHFLHY